MNYRDAALRMVNEAGGYGPAAAALGMTANSLKNRLYNQRGQWLLHPMMMQLQELSGSTHYASAVAAESGGTFVHHPCVKGLTDSELDELWAKLMEYFSKFGSVWVRSTSDGEITDSERKDIVDVTDQCHQTLDMLVAVSLQIMYRKKVDHG